MERTLEHESSLLSKMNHPNIVGFRAAQRLSDGHVCLALEHCECSLYALIQDRASPDGSCLSPSRRERAGCFFSADEVALIGRSVSSGLAYLHTEHHTMHGDVKSANILVSRDLTRVKICDLGVSIRLSADLRKTFDRRIQYEGTDPWRPPETLLRVDGDFCESDDEEDSVMHLCDRTDVFAFGLVIWETLSGDVPHAAVHANGEEAYRQALGTRPPLPPNLPQQFVNLEHIYRCCTEHEPDNRPSASELTYWLHPDAEPLQSVHRD